ncbi:uncharacterized protein LOC112568517 [Pomacea canaliculata]|uniref:uncharacterized protein LOC112568517 n=1 Tax=Pomacea canaliculata TaxID=400727 RepID=UPI000D72B03D|nr:uncharacterized protein LOC112568517 [Pomacea canaliculata]
MLETATMVTSPTTEKMTKGEVKVSGSCQFNTTLPRKEGNYSFLVSVSPGKRNFMAEDKQFTVERPRSPTALCGPQPYVLENTAVTCTCSTTSLGQPAGYLRWVTGNQTHQSAAVTKEKQEPTSKGLQYDQVLILSDHGSTWLRCDIIWGAEVIPGEKYTASVGFQE